MFACFDPVALDQACADACMKVAPLRNSVLGDNMAAADFKDLHDPFRNTTPKTDWETQLSHGEKIGIGSRQYDLVMMK